MFKDFPTQVSAKFRRLLFEIDLGFLGTRAEIIKYAKLVSKRESWEILFPYTSARFGHRRRKESLENGWLWVGSGRKELVKGGFICTYFSHLFLRLSGSFGSKAIRLQCSTLRLTFATLSFDLN